MHKNTLLTIGTLAIIAALLLGFNFGRKFNLYTFQPSPQPTSQPLVQTPTSSPKPSPTLEASGSAQGIATASASPADLFSYHNTSCSYTVGIPKNWTYEEIDGTSTSFKTSTQEELLISCSDEIPAIQSEKGHEITVHGFPATKFTNVPLNKQTTVTIVVIKRNEKSLLISGADSTVSLLLQTIQLESK